MTAFLQLSLHFPCRGAGFQPAERPRAGCPRSDRGLARTQRTQSFHAKNAKLFRFPVACILIAGIACVGCHPAGSRNTAHAIAAEQEERSARSIVPLPNDLKKNVVESMTLPEIERLLGPSHETFGFGIAYHVWYFDDHTCLVMTSLEKEPFIWLPCGPGEFSFDLLKQERMKTPAP